MKQTKILLSAFAALAALMLAGCSTSPKQEETAAHEVILPGEQAPPMDAGQNNFGGSAADRGDTTGRAERLRQRAAEMNRIRTPTPRRRPTTSPPPAGACGRARTS